jgi:hypothetical protein
MAHRVVTEKVTHLTDTHSTVMTENQGILYLAPKGLGMTYPGSKQYIGKDYRDVLGLRYSQRSSFDKDWYGDVWVYETNDGDTVAHDDEIRSKIYRLYQNDEIEFSAYSPKDNPAPDGANSEALINFNPERDWGTLNTIIGEYFDKDDIKNTADPWSPRFGQPGAVDETVEKLRLFDKCAVNGYTGFAKTMIGSAAVHEYYEFGAFMLFTTPVIDTLNDVIENFQGWHYPNTVLGVNSRNRPTRVYTKDDLRHTSINEMREQADSGAIIVLALSVQGVRYDDEPEQQDKSVNTKYAGLLDVDIDLWIKDERHLQYNGKVTQEVFGKLKPTQELDLSASINKIRDQYHPGQIVDRGLFWSIENRTQLGLPKIFIDVLCGAVHETLSEKDQDRFDPEYGFLPRKMTEIVDGILVSHSAFDAMFTAQYIQDDDRDENPMSIRCDETLPEISKRVGLHVLPAGVNGVSAEQYITMLEASLNDSPKWNTGKAIWITPYNWQKHVNYDAGATTPEKVVEYLLTQYEHVNILTHRMWTTGSNIPPIGHVVLWDKVVDPYNLEQLFPGRAYRVYDGKTHIKVYVMHPGHSVTDAFCAIAQKTSSVRQGIPDPITLLKNLRLSKYNGIRMESVNHQELFREFHDRNFKTLRSTVPTDQIDSVLSEEENSKLLELDIDNKHLGDTGEFELTPDNGGKKQEDSDSDGIKKRKTRKKKTGAEIINAVMMEITPFVYLEKLTDVYDALNHKQIRKMFDNEAMDDLISIVDQNTSLYNVLQEKVIALNHAFSTGRTFEEIHDIVFRNTFRKKKAGLVFINMKSAHELAEMFMTQMELDENFNGTIAVQNALSGSVAFCLKKIMKYANIVCVEQYGYYIDHLNSNGFTVVDSDTLEKEYMAQIKFWFQNPPYQKDAGGDNKDDNKQGDFWFEFVEKAMMSPASTDDAKYFIVAPKSMFGAGRFGTKSYKPNKVRAMGGEFKHSYPCLNKFFPGIGIEIGGYVIDKEKTNSIVTIDGTDETMIVDGTSPVPFYVSATATSVIAKTWQVQQTMPNFRDTLEKQEDGVAVLRLQGGQYKTWKKTTVGYEKDTDNNKNGTVIDENEIPGYQSAVNSQLWEYIFKVFGGNSGNSPTGFMKHMPIMDDMTRAYTDEEWFQAFNITPEQQQEIRKFNQDNK